MRNFGFVKKILCYIALTRPINLFFVVLTQVLCAFYILNLTPTWQLFVFFLGSALITAAGYVINDYFDIKADAINKPKKVYVGRTISRRQALLFVFILNFSTLGMSLIANSKFIYIYCGITIFGLWFYSYLLKRTFLIGNLLIASLAGFSVYILSYWGEANNLLISFSFFAFLTNLIREIVKDSEDIKGDLLLNAKTLPIVIGIKKTRIIIITLNFILLGFIWLAFLHYQNWKLLASVLVISSLLFYCSYLLLNAKLSKLSFKKGSQVLKLIMLIGCLSIPLL